MDRFSLPADGALEPHRIGRSDHGGYGGAVGSGRGPRRFAGTQVVSRLQAAQREGALQQHLLAGDMALACAGLLLMVPGLISDALAVLIMIPPVRRLLAKFMGLRGVSAGAQFTHSAYSPQADVHARSEGDDGVTLEGEFQELDAAPPAIERHGSDETGRS